MLGHVGAPRFPYLRHITVFSSALHIRISATAGPAQILLQFTGTVTAMGRAMAGRPRVIVALPDWTEGSLVANWLSENQFEPYSLLIDHGSGRERNPDTAIQFLLFRGCEAGPSATCSRTAGPRVQYDCP